uniref:Uncharacterized protein n=1 Tax=Desmarestia aculeata TaxID=62298 RepID=A0A8F0FC49_9PHAE|nr:hypothetical protein [Desmarestia aculeata]
MKSAKNHSKNELVKLYDSCPIFKKYCQFNLWSEEFGEYDKVKYCETYLYRYISTFTQEHLLQCFSPSFLAVLHTSPSFMKFIKSGFIKYIDFHFLLFFQYNSFHHSNDSFEDIEIFVEEYFQKYSRKVFEEDLLKCLIKSVNELVPIALQGFMDSRLRFFYKKTISARRSLSNSGRSESEILISRKFCPLGYSGDEDIINDFYLFFVGTLVISSFVIAEIFFSSFLKFDNKLYRSGHFSLDPLGIVFTDFFNIVLADTIYGWGLYFGGSRNKKKITPIIFVESFLDKSSFVFNYFYKFNNLGRHTKIIFMLANGYEWCFYTSLYVNYKPLNILLSFRPNIKVFNKDVHKLLEFFVDHFANEENDIHIAIHKNNIFKGDFESCFLGISSSNFENLIKRFDASFSKYSNKSHIIFLDTSLTVTKKALNFISSVENIFTYFDRSSLTTYIDFNKDIEYLDGIPQRSYEEGIFCFNSNLKGILLFCEDIFMETFEGTSLPFEEISIDIFENLEKVAIKTYAYIPITKKQFVFLSLYCLDNTVSEWGLYYPEFSAVKKGGCSSDSSFFFTKHSLIFRYLYENNKKVFGWESAYLINCCFIWGICDRNLKITFDKLLEVKPNKVASVGG